MSLTLARHGAWFFPDGDGGQGGRVAGARSPVRPQACCLTPDPAAPPPLAGHGAGRFDPAGATV
ncbi:hypothetical protein GRZ55_06655 [Chelativorans sp. ZYF759]|uniref:hypothetical protein n=1 Tax=Chelativorans sp. ZYF759 TaxID=2692213 RepID=UPI00145E7B12|nr:hypothetical protein [Chelativorans sp. ZYF759]NMG38923.1 hypothetical protein [Chelativorans sp. ZYF759]